MITTVMSLVLLVMAVASGAASLAYQVVWMRRLALVLGSTTLATSTVLAAFLGGLAIGTWLWGRVADRRPQSTLIVFAVIEIATGLYGFASLWIFRGVEALYLAAYPALADRASLFTGLQFVLSALAILPPVILMGGSLPLLARMMMRRMVVDAGGIVRCAGALYGWNTLGAAAGAAAATYALLPAVGLTATVRLAAAVNLLVGAAAFAAFKHERLRMQARAERERDSAKPPTKGAASSIDARSRKQAEPLATASSPMPSGVIGDLPDPMTRFLILMGFALSGFAATTFEIVWTRLLAMVMGSSVYAYGTLIVVVLAGLGLGSALYSREQRTAEEHQRAFALRACWITFTAALSVIILPRIPLLFVRYFPLFRDAFGWQIAAHFAVAAMVALIPSLLFGATFPAAVGSLGGSAARLGRTIGAAYAANTIGTVAGAWLAGFVLIPTIGLRATMTIGVLAAAATGASVWWRVRSPRLLRLPALAPAVAGVLIAVLVPAWPREVFAAGIGFFAPRYGIGEAFDDIVGRMRLLYYRDGISSTISVDETGQTLYYRSNGKTDASTEAGDMANQLLLGHLPMLLHPAPRNVFVLGLGTGMTAAAVARYPVQQIDIVELEPAGAEAARFFDRYTRKVLDDPRVQLTIGDGRNRLLALPKQYDVVISDPSDIWVAGTGSLATLEYYRTVRARLRPGGVFVQWIHTHTLLPEDFALLTATFHAVFPHTQIWTSAQGNLILLGADEAVGWDYARLKEHFARTPGVAEDLESIGIWDPFALFGAHLLGEDEVNELVRTVGGLHTDDHPVLEFRTPRSLYVETTPMVEQALDKLRRPEAPSIAGLNPERDLDADGTYLLGFAYASLGRPELGIPYMERSTNMAPDRPQFFVGLAHQYREAGRIPDAEKSYERALTLDLNNVEALVSLGEIRLDGGQIEWTRVLADRALRRAPQNARVHVLIERLLEAER